MHKWLGFIILLPNIAWAQTVQITEIAPHTLALEPEWFEFRVTGSAVIDMSGWHVSNGGDNPKNFSDFIAELTIGEGVNQTEDDLVFEISESGGYFSFLPSPIGLPNGGGTIQILDDSKAILTEANYAEAKSRSTKNYEEREIFAWNEASQNLMPQLIRAPMDVKYTHSRGSANSELPTDPLLYDLGINEVSVDHDDTDFIEIKVVTDLDKVNLKGTEIKHNGTSLWHFEGAFWVKPKDLIMLKVGTQDIGKVGKNSFHTNKKDGLSGGSGTIEILNLQGTSQETTADALCWQKKTLSQTEGKRVSKYIAAQTWSGPCINIENLIPNESLARPVAGTDSNTATDWFRHFNGSPGGENINQNQSPQAVISLQGSKKTLATVPFLLNVTGADSTDPDGAKDIKSYRWFLNNTLFSEAQNPKGFYIEAVGEHNLKLEVADQSGQNHEAQLTVMGVESLNLSASGNSTAVKTALKKEAFNKIIKAEKETEALGFIAYFAAKPGWMEVLNKIQPEAIAAEPQAINENLYEADWARRINLPIPVRQRVKKNLGILFSWRESPWPDLTKEWSAVVAADRKKGYFEVVYRGF